MGVGFKLPLGVVLVAVLLLVVMVVVAVVLVVFGTRFGKDVSSSMVTSTALVWASISNGKKVRDKEMKDEVEGRVTRDRESDRKIRKY